MPNSSGAIRRNDQMQVANPDRIKIWPVQILHRHAMRISALQSSSSVPLPVSIQNPAEARCGCGTEVPEPRTTSRMKES
jgi:hypothetical protein